MKHLLDEFITKLDFTADTTAIDKVDTKLKHVHTTTSQVDKAVKLLQHTLEGIGAYLITEKIMEYGNEYDNLRNRLRSTGLEGESLNSTFEKLLKTSSLTGVSIHGLAELYQQLNVGIGDIVSSDELSSITENMAKIFTISNVDAQHQRAALGDLSRGLEGATVNFREIRSAMTDIPKLQSIISEHFKKLGTTAQDALQGNKFATIDFVKIIQEATKSIDSDFAKTERTVTRAMTGINTAMVDFFGTLRDNSGFTKVIVDGLDESSSAISNWTKKLKNHANLAEGIMISLGAVVAGIGAYLAVAFAPILAALAMTSGAFLLLIAVVDDVITYMNGGTSVIGTIVDYWVDIFNKLPIGVKGVFATIYGMLKLLVKGFLWAGEKIGNGITRIIDFLMHPINTIKKSINDLLSWIESTSLGKWFAKKMGFDINIVDKAKEVSHQIKHKISNIDLNALSHNMTNGMAMAGLPNSHQSYMSNYSDHSNINISINPTGGADHQAIANEVVTRINESKQSYRQAVLNHDSKVGI